MLVCMPGGGQGGSLQGDWLGAVQAAGKVACRLLVRHAVRRQARCTCGGQADRLVGVGTRACLGGCLVSPAGGLGAARFGDVYAWRQLLLGCTEKAPHLHIPSIQTRSWDGAWPAGLAWSASPPPGHLGEKLNRRPGLEVTRGPQGIQCSAPRHSN